jgi:hypothetical protein
MNRVNLVTNPSFKTDTSGWTTVGTGTSFVRSTTDGFYGSTCLEVTKPALNSTGVSWTSAATPNLVSNSSFESAPSDTVSRTNLLTNPSFEAEASTVVTARTNLVTNPGFETSSSTATIRTNRILNPRFEAAPTVTTSRINLLINSSFEATTVETTARTNLCTNPSFEHATTPISGWAAVNGASRAASTAQKNIGAQSLLVTYGAAAGATYTGVGYALTLAASTTYTFSAYVYTPSGSVFPQLSVQSSVTPAFTAVISSNATSTGAWQRLSVTFTTTAAGSYTCYVLNSAAVTGTKTFYLDNVLIEQTSILKPYFDGATSGTGTEFTYNWTSTAHLSTSEQKYFKNPTWGYIRALSGIASTAQCLYGTKSALLTADGSPGAFGMYNSGIGSARTAVTAGSTYTSSIYVRDINTAVSYYAAIEWYNSSGGSAGATSTGTVTAVNSSGWTRISVSAAAPTEAVTAVPTFYSNTAPASGTQVYFDGALFDFSAEVRPYFDGDTAAANEFTYSWSGTAHASTSLQKFNAAPSYSFDSLKGVVARSSATSPFVGTYSGLVTSLSSFGTLGTYSSNSTVTAGTTYVGSIYVKDLSLGRTIQVNIDWRGSGGYISSSSGTATAISTGSWTRISVTGVAPSGATGASLVLAVPSTAPYGSQFYIDAALLEAGSYVNTYFDGSTTATGDFTHAWTGTADASSSNQVANMVDGWSNVYNPEGLSYGFYRTNADKQNGSYSMALAMYQGTGANPINLGTPILSAITASKTYTSSIYVYTNRTQNINFVFTVTTAAGSTYPGVVTSVPGGTWTRINYTYTMPSNLVSSTVQIQPSAPKSGDYFYFDQFLLEESSILKSYFDGSTAAAGEFTYSWSGTANASTSIQQYSISSTWGSIGSLSAITSTAQYLYGAKSTLATADGSGTFGIYNSGVSSARTAVTAGKSYTSSIYVKDIDTGVSYYAGIEWKDSGGSSAGATSTGTVTAVNSSGWTRISVTATAPTGAVTAIPTFYSGTTPASGKQVYFDGALFEQASEIKPYFDGNIASANEFTYAWSGTAHISTSLEKYSKVPSWAGDVNSVIARSSVTSYIGTYSGLVTSTNSSSKLGLFIITGTSVTPGKAYSASIYAKDLNLGMTVRVEIHWYNGSSYITNSTSAYTSISTTDWTKLSVTGTAPTNATLGYIVVNSSSNAPFGKQIYVDAAVLEQSSVPTSYFNGTAVATKAGTTYAASLYVKIPVGQETSSFKIYLYWYDFTGTQISFTSSALVTVTSDDGWVRLGVASTAPTNAVIGEVRLDQPTAGTSGKKFLVDAVLLEESSYYGQYFDDFTQDQETTKVNNALRRVPPPHLTGMQLNADININGLILNTIDENNVVWVCTDIKNWWALPEPEVPDIGRGLDDGSYDVRGRWKARAITLEGSILPPDVGSMVAARSKLIAALSPLVYSGGILAVDEGPIKVSKVFMVGQPNMEVKNARGRIDFSVQLRSGDPVKYEWNYQATDGYFSVTPFSYKTSGSISNVSQGLGIRRYYATNTFVVGDYVTISGVSPSGYNTESTSPLAITAVDPNGAWFEVSGTSSGAYVSETNSSAKLAYSNTSITNSGNTSVPTIITITGPISSGSYIKNTTNNTSMKLVKQMRAASYFVNIGYVSRYGNVATLTTTNSTGHGLFVGDVVNISISSDPGSFSASSVTITSTTTNTFTYDSAGSDVSLTSVAGSTTTLVSADIAVIDTYNQTVKYRGIADAGRSILDANIDWLKLVPGSNNIQVQTGDSSVLASDSKVVVQYRSGWIG